MNLQEKQKKIKELFATCGSEEDKYKKIIEIGKELGSLPSFLKTESTRVTGCQSQMYLHAFTQEGLLFFQGESDALISAGLAALLIRVYSGERPEVILTEPPTYLEELKIGDSLTPNRASGLYSIHLRMKQDALKVLTATQNP